MQDHMADLAKDWPMLALTGMGISFAPHEYFGGMFLALAASAFVVRAYPEKNLMELWLVLLGAFLTAHVAAIGAFIWFPDLPVQVAMVTAGFFSRHVTRFALKLAGVFETRSDKIADRIIDKVLPGPDGEDK